MEFHLLYNLNAYFVSREAWHWNVFPETKPHLLHSETFTFTVFGMSVCVRIRIWKQLWRAWLPIGIKQNFCTCQILAASPKPGNQDIMRVNISWTLKEFSGVQETWVDVPFSQHLCINFCCCDSNFFFFLSWNLWCGHQSQWETDRTKWRREFPQPNPVNTLPTSMLQGRHNTSLHRASLSLQVQICLQTPPWRNGNR